MDKNKITIAIPCAQCGVVHKIHVNLDDYEAWQNGDKLVQEAFPYLSPEKRELLISRICPDCWDKMFDQY